MKKNPRSGCRHMRTKYGRCYHCLKVARQWPKLDRETWNGGAYFSNERFEGGI